MIWLHGFLGLMRNMHRLELGNFKLPMRRALTVILPTISAVCVGLPFLGFLYINNVVWLVGSAVWLLRVYRLW